MLFMWQQYNPNPVGRAVGDCAVRAVAAALDISWEDAYALIAANGYAMGDMPSSNSVWGAVLVNTGSIATICRKLVQHVIPLRISRQTIRAAFSSSAPEPM